MPAISCFRNTLSLNGIEMYYEIHGEGYPLLLLHGFTGSGASLVQGFKQLSKEYQLIVPDLRGHGRSTNPTSQFTFRQSALDIFALLENLGIDQCSAIGFSGGGCTLLQMAYLHPEKVKSMILVSAAPYFPPATRKFMKQFRIEDKTEDEWAAMRLIHVHGDAQIQSLWEQANAFGNSDDMNFTHEMLAKIKAKTLLIQGDRDPIYPLELTIEMYEFMQDAYLWIVPGGGHVPISQELFPEFINYLKKFIITQ